MLCEAPFTAAAAAASAAAFNKAIVWDLGRRPRTPLRTGRGGKGLGSRYEVCMEDEEQLDDERRAARETDVEDTGAWSALGRVTGRDRRGEIKIYIVIPSVMHRVIALH